MRAWARRESRVSKPRLSCDRAAGSSRRRTRCAAASRRCPMGVAPARKAGDGRHRGRRLDRGSIGEGADQRHQARSHVDRRGVRRGRGDPDRANARRALPRLRRDPAEQDQNDFDDYIFSSLRLLQEQPDVASRWQERYSAVLVDEYQDIEPAQELLVQTMAAPEDLLFCVGDEDQCLYAWRRASVERVIELDQLYPGLERHALGRNYRCPRSWWMRRGR